MIDIRTAANPRVRCGRDVEKVFFAAVGILYEAVAFRGGEVLDAPCGGQYFHFLLLGCRNLDLRDVYLRLGFDILGRGVQYAVLVHIGYHILERTRTAAFAFVLAFLLFLSFLLLELFPVSFTCRYSFCHSMLLCGYRPCRGTVSVGFIVFPLSDTCVESSKGARFGGLSLGIRNYGTWISCLSVKKSPSFSFCITSDACCLQEAVYEQRS